MENTSKASIHLRAEGIPWKICGICERNFWNLWLFKEFVKVLPQR